MHWRKHLRMILASTLLLRTFDKVQAGPCHTLDMLLTPLMCTFTCIFLSLAISHQLHLIFSPLCMCDIFHTLVSCCRPLLRNSCLHVAFLLLFLLHLFYDLHFCAGFQRSKYFVVEMWLLDGNTLSFVIVNFLLCASKYYWISVYV